VGTDLVTDGALPSPENKCDKLSPDIQGKSMVMFLS